MNHFPKTGDSPFAMPAPAKTNAPSRAWVVRALSDAGAQSTEQRHERAELVRAAMQCAASDT